MHQFWKESLGRPTAWKKMQCVLSNPRICTCTYSSSTTMLRLNHPKKVVLSCRIYLATAKALKHISWCVTEPCRNKKVNENLTDFGCQGMWRVATSDVATTASVCILFGLVTWHRLSSSFAVAASPRAPSLVCEVLGFRRLWPEKAKIRARSRMVTSLLFFFGHSFISRGCL